jgi:hypothetical protein
VVGKKKPEIDVDVERALGAPFVMPAGGNWLEAQGPYGIPVYPVYHKHLFGNPKDRRVAMRQGFLKDKEAIRYYLRQRLERTGAFRLDDSMLSQVVDSLSRVLVSADFGDSKNVLAVLVLVRCEPGGFYEYSDRASLTHIGESRLRPGKFIESSAARIASDFLDANVHEGATKGRLSQSVCSVSGQPGPVVSAYCKAWPWAFPTWTCPVPHGGDTKLLVEGVALSEASYRALTLGANLFQRLTRRLHYVVLPELFAPAENRDRQNVARNRRLSDLTAIHGSAFLLPVQDTALANPDDQGEFARRLLDMLAAPESAQPLADRYLTAVTGFDVLLPEELNRADFRLTLVYFSGDVSRGDVHLRAYIQNVVPSTANDLKRVVRPCREQMAGLLRVLTPRTWEKVLPYLDPRYQSVPYFLARGYGGSYLWVVLEQCLHRRALDVRPITAHVAARIRSVVPRWPGSRFEIIDEIIFLLVCRDFLYRYNREVADPPKEDAMPMRPWQELIRVYEREPIEAMEFRSVAELGFACGLVVRRFSGWYYSTQDKDFLKHRVLTFGTDLGPKDIQRGVAIIRSVAAKFDDLQRMVEAGQLAYYPKEERKQHIGDYQRRLGAVLNALNSLSGEVEENRDEFVSGFWSGYCLQGYDRPRAVAGAPASANGGES